MSLDGAVRDGRAHGAGRGPNREISFSRREIRKGLQGVAGEGLENMGCDGKEWALKAREARVLSQHNPSASHLISLHLSLLISKNGTYIRSLSWCRQVSER